MCSSLDAGGRAVVARPPAAIGRPRANPTPKPLPGAGRRARPSLPPGGRGRVAGWTCLPTDAVGARGGRGLACARAARPPRPSLARGPPASCTPPPRPDGPGPGPEGPPQTHNRDDGHAGKPHTLQSLADRPPTRSRPLQVRRAVAARAARPLWLPGSEAPKHLDGRRAKRGGGPVVVGWLVAVGDGGRDASPPPQAARQTARPGLERWQRAPSQRLRPAYPPLPNPPPPPPSLSACPPTMALTPWAWAPTPSPSSTLRRREGGGNGGVEADEVAWRQARPSALPDAARPPSSLFLGRPSACTPAGPCWLSPVSW